MRLLVLAAAAAQQAERHERHRLALQVAGLARDAQRLAEIFLGEIPLSEPVADQAQVLAMAAHARIEAGALVEAQRLLEESRRFAPFAQVLIDEAEIVERGDQPVDVVDAAERGGRALQPLDRLRRPAEPIHADPEGHAHLADRAMVVGVAQHRVGVLRVAAAGAIGGELGEQVRRAGGDTGIESRVVKDAGVAAGFARQAQRSLELAAPHLCLGQPRENPHALGGHVRADQFEGGGVLLYRAREIVSGQMQISDRLALPDAISKRAGGVSQIGGDRSLHFSNPRMTDTRWKPRRFVPRLRLRPVR